jgi:L-lactate utilization protein LutB
VRKVDEAKPIEVVRVDVQVVSASSALGDALLGASHEIRVGLGRVSGVCCGCARNCPVNIDIRKVVEDISKL